MIAVIGGTGKLGKGLVKRLALANYEVSIGSRSTEKAKKIADEINEKIDKKIKGYNNLKASQKAETIILSIPLEPWKR